MKKVYINPEMKVVKLHTMGVLANSIGTLDTTTTVKPGTEDASGLFGSDEEEW